jgi:hypothetical protein
MTATKRKFILELLVDTVTLTGLPEPLLIGDIRMSVGLSELPVVHIKPAFSDPRSSIHSGTIPFGGSGKLCEFSMSQSELEAANLTLLVLKDIPTINDHLILCMTAPVSFRDLILSLPSCVPQPFVRRDFTFVDNKGNCSVYIRVTNPVALCHGSQSTLLRTARPATRPLSIVRTPSTPMNTTRRVHVQEFMQPAVPSPDPILPRPMPYGGLRNRPSILH